MNRPLLPMLLVAIAVAGTGLGSRLSAIAQTPAQSIGDLMSNLKGMQAELDESNRRLARTKELYKNGMMSQSQLDEAQTNTDRLTRAVEQVQRQRDEAIARQAFSRPVDITLDHSTVRQFAAVVSKSAGISVQVDPAVSTQTALTLDAHDVPVANVLEAVAQKADLMIAPSATGVMLKNWPRLNDRVYRSATAPWSAEWGVPPTLAGALMVSGFQSPGNPFGAFPPGGANGGVPGAQRPDGFPGQDPRGGNGEQGPFFGGNPPMGMVPGSGPQQGAGRNPFAGDNMPGMRPEMPFTMTHLADNLIAIAEPGVNVNGEPGVWLTAYRFDGSGFRKMGQGFHPFNSGSRRGPGGGMPGMGDGPRGQSAPPTSPGGRQNGPNSAPRGDLRPPTDLPGGRPGVPGDPPHGGVRPPLAHVSTIPRGARAEPHSF